MVNQEQIARLEAERARLLALNLNHAEYIKPIVAECQHRFTEQQLKAVLLEAFAIALDNQTSHPKEPLRFTHTDLSAALDWLANKLLSGNL